jgi:hypothetical protein
MIQVETMAPAGKYRVVGVDTFDGTDWVEGDFDSKEAATAHADERTDGKEMLKMHVYDDKGRHVYDAGTF